MAKYVKNQIFIYFLQFTLNFKKSRQQSKFELYRVLSNIAAHIQAKRRKGQIKTKGAFPI